MVVEELTKYEKTTLVDIQSNFSKNDSFKSIKEYEIIKNEIIKDAEKVTRIISLIKSLMTGPSEKDERFEIGEGMNVKIDEDICGLNFTIKSKILFRDLKELLDGAIYILNNHKDKKEIYSALTDVETFFSRYLNNIEEYVGAKTITRTQNELTNLLIHLESNLKKINDAARANQINDFLKNIKSAEVVLNKDAVKLKKFFVGYVENGTEITGIDKIKRPLSILSSGYINSKNADDELKYKKEIIVKITDLKKIIDEVIPSVEESVNKTHEFILVNLNQISSVMVFILNDDLDRRIRKNPEKKVEKTYSLDSGAEFIAEQNKIMKLKSKKFNELSNKLLFQKVAVDTIIEKSYFIKKEKEKSIKILDKNKLAKIHKNVFSKNYYFKFLPDETILRKFLKTIEEIVTYSDYLIKSELKLMLNLHEFVVKQNDNSLNYYTNYLLGEYKENISEIKFGKPLRELFNSLKTVDLNDENKCLEILNYLSENIIKFNTFLIELGKDIVEVNKILENKFVKTKS